MKLEDMKRAIVEAIVDSKHVHQLDIFGERDASMVDRIMAGFQIVETAYFQRIALLDPNATLPLNKEKVIGQFVTEFTLGGSQVNGETLVDLWKETCAQFKANDIKKIGKEILSLIERFNTDKGTHEMVDKMKAMHVKEPHWVDFQKELPEFKWVVLSEKYSIADVLDYLIVTNGVSGLDSEEAMSKHMRILDFIYQIPNNQAPGVLEYFNIPSLPVKTPEKIGEEIESAINLKLVQQLDTSISPENKVKPQQWWIDFQKELPKLQWGDDLQGPIKITQTLERLVTESISAESIKESTEKYNRILDFISQVPSKYYLEVFNYFAVPYKIGLSAYSTPEEVGTLVDKYIKAKLFKESTINKSLTQERSVKPKCNCGKIGCPSNNEDTDFINIRQQLMSVADFPALLKRLTQQAEPKPLIIDLGSTDGTDLVQMVEDIKESLFNPKIKLNISDEPPVDFDKLINLWLNYITESPAVESAEKFHNLHVKFHTYMENQTEENMNEALLALRSYSDTGKDTAPMLGDFIFQHGGLDYTLPDVGAGKQSAIEYFIGLDFSRGKPTSEDPLMEGFQQHLDRYKQNRLSRGSYFFEELFPGKGKEPVGNGRLSPSQILDVLFGEKKSKATEITSSTNTVLNQNFVVCDTNGNFSCEYKMIWTNGKVRVMYTHSPSTVGESRQFRHIIHNHDCTEQEAINIFANLRESTLN